MTARRRRQALIALGVVAALNAVVYGVYTLPRTLQERWLAARRDTLRQEVEREGRQVGALKAQTDAVRSNTADTQRFYQSVVGIKTASLVPVLREIEAMAREGGLRPGAATYATLPVKGAWLERFQITMPVQGTYQQLANFVERLEGSSYFLTLDQVEVRGDRQGGRAELAMVLSCYFRAAGSAEAAKRS